MTSIELARGRPVRSGLERMSQVVGIDARLLGMVLVLIAIWLVLNLLTGGAFLSARNLFNLSLQVAVVGVMATGMVLVIVSRNIDLSIGSILGFVGVFGALAQTEYLGLGHGYTWWVTSLLMLLVGTAIGAGQGAIIAYGGVPSFVVTLGGLLFFRNAAFQINLGATVAPLDETFQLLGGGLNGTIGAFWSWVCGGVAILLIAASAISIRRRRQRFGFPVRTPLAEAVVIGVWSVLVLAFVWVMNSYLQPKTGVPMGIAIPVLILIGVTLIMTVIARKTGFGRYVYAIGGNPESAELAGISVKRTIVEVFALMGFLIGRRLDHRHGAAQRRRERHRHDDRTQRHRRRGHRRDLARRRHRHDLRRRARRGVHAEPRKRHGAARRADAAAEDGDRGRPRRSRCGSTASTSGAGR